MPLRDHYKSIERQTGVTPEALLPVDCAPEVKYLWGYFLSMHSRRGSSGFGSNPISNEEVEAWARRQRIALSAFEDRALDALEQLYMRITAEQSKKSK